MVRKRCKLLVLFVRQNYALNLFSICFVFIGSGRADTSMFPEVDSTWKVCKKLILAIYL